METIYIKNLKEVKKSLPDLEKKLKIKIKLNGRMAEFEGEAFNEFEAVNVFDAINFGFSSRKALQLLDENMQFKKIHIKKFTHRKLKDILSRLIGTHGKTKKTISEISGCDILINDGEVGLIGDVERIYDAETAIVNLIKGSKQSNMYRYLERRNKERRTID